MFLFARLCSFCFILSLITVLMACSVSDRWVHEDSEGVVPESFFKSIKRNKTEKTWVLDNLGSPHSIAIGPNQEEIATYRFKRTRYRSAHLLVVLRYSGSVQDTEHFHLVYCDDIVKKAWWDELPEVQTERLTRRSKCKKKKMDAEKMPDTNTEMKSDENKMIGLKPSDEKRIHLSGTADTLYVGFRQLLPALS